MNDRQGLHTVLTQSCAYACLAFLVSASVHLQISL